MKRYIGIAGFLAAFVLAMVAVGFIGEIVSFFVWHFFYDTDVYTVPRLYWPVVWTLAVPMAVAAGIHSYRATLRRYQSKI